MEKNNRIFILIFLGMLTAFGPFVTDMYLPTLPSMAEYFGTSAYMVQLGLSSGMAGLAIGQLIFGPISDRTGRKPPLVTALVLFLAATAGCIYAADIYTGRDLAAMLAVIGAINGIAPVTAPVIGGALAGGTGWHGIFWCLFGIGAMLLGGTAHFRETHQVKPADSISEGRTKGASRKGSPVIEGFTALSRNRLYMCCILQFAFSQAVLFTNISSSPFIMQEHYGFSPMMFSICFGANALAIGAAAALSLKFRTMEQAFLTGSVGMSAVSVLLCAAMCLGCSFWLYEILLLCLLAMLGLTFTSSNTLAMDAGREHAGAASALLGASGFAAGGLVSPLAGIGDIMISSGILFVAGSVLSSVFAIAAVRMHTTAGDSLSRVKN